MKILVVYGSTLGKTQRVANYIAEIISNSGTDIKVKDARETTIKELYGYDLIILGSSTWDDGMLQFDFRTFQKVLLSSTFKGMNFSIFVLGSEKYPHPFGAATILEDTINSIHGELIVPTLKLDIDHDDPEDKQDPEIQEWVNQLINNI